MLCQFMDKLRGLSFLDDPHSFEVSSHYAEQDFEARVLTDRKWVAMRDEHKAASEPLEIRIINSELEPLVKYSILQKLKAQNEQSGRHDAKYTEWLHALMQVKCLRKCPDNPRIAEILSCRDDVARRGMVQRFLNGTKLELQSAIYGHENVKGRILEIIASWISNPDSKLGKIIGIHGSMGTGKTKIVYDGIAKALGRPCASIQVGAESDATLLKGTFYPYEGSTYGRIIGSLIHTQSTNPILYFDELDKVNSRREQDEIANALIHITDPEQNQKFQDRYFRDIDFDISDCTFIFSFNDIDKINPILRDRIQLIKVPDYNSEDKLAILRDFMYPILSADIGCAHLSFRDDFWPALVQEFSPIASGMRPLKHVLQTLLMKLNLMQVLGEPICDGEPIGIEYTKSLLGDFEKAEEDEQRRRSQSLYL